MAQHDALGSRSLSGRAEHGSRWGLWLLLLAVVLAAVALTLLLIRANDDDEDSSRDLSAGHVQVTEDAQVERHHAVLA